MHGFTRNGEGLSFRGAEWLNRYPWLVYSSSNLPFVFIVDFSPLRGIEEVLKHPSHRMVNAKCGYVRFNTRNIFGGSNNDLHAGISHVI